MGEAGETCLPLEKGSNGSATESSQLPPIVGGAEIDEGFDRARLSEILKNQLAARNRDAAKEISSRVAPKLVYLAGIFLDGCFGFLHRTRHSIFLRLENLAFY